MTRITMTRSFAGFPLASWGFAIRIWIAMILALYVAFWLQLESAASAAVCVSVLALPTRGQTLQKAAFRCLATVIGIAASVVIAGLFAQVRELFLLAFATWLGLCVFASGMLDGNRAYAGVLSGYTVAIVAVTDIDAPQQIFMSGLNRGAAIATGIAAIALVNDLLATPDIYPKLLKRLEAVRGNAQEFCLAALRDDARAADAAHLLAEVTALRPDVTLLPIESSAGRARAAAIRSTVAALVGELQAARALILLAALPEARADAIGPAIATLLARGDHRAFADFQSRYEDGPPSGEERWHRLFVHQALELLDHHLLVSDGLAACAAGRKPVRDVSLPIYRSWQAAARNGIRVFLAVALTAPLLILSGWPATSTALTLLGVTAALSSTSPSPAAFAQGGMIAVPIVIVMVGGTEFFVLDGVDQFPLLAIALAPSVILASLLLASPNPKVSGLGFLLLVFVPDILQPSNPQRYDPQFFLTFSTQAIMGVVALFVALLVLLPTTDRMKRRWLLRSARNDLRSALSRSSSRRPAAEAAFRDADRVGQIAGLRDGSDEARLGAVDQALLLADLAATARRIFRDLGQPAAHDVVGREVVEGFAAFEPSRLLAASETLWDRCERSAGGRKASRLAANLEYAVVLIDTLRAADAGSLARVMR